MHWLNQNIDKNVDKSVKIWFFFWLFFLYFFPFFVLLLVETWNFDDFLLNFHPWFHNSSNLTRTAYITTKQLASALSMFQNMSLVDKFQEEESEEKKKKSRKKKFLYSVNFTEGYYRERYILHYKTKSSLICTGVIL